MAGLKIYLLGGLKLLWNDESLPAFPTRKTRTIFAYLVTYRHRVHTRLHLAGTFWPDFPESRAHRNLNTTLWRLRQVLPEGYLLSDGDIIGFNPDSDYWLDVDVFSKGCESSDIDDPESVLRLENAVHLYRGEFLAGLYQDWALEETERLRSIYLQTLFDLMAYYQGANELERALNFGRRYLSVDPLREEIHRKVMLLLARSGQREAALTQYQTCLRLLKDDLGIEPIPATVALYEQIRHAPETQALTAKAHRMHAAPPLSASLAAPLPASPLQTGQPISLIGRQAQRETLLTRLDALRDGTGGMIFIEGTPGIGKTRLVEAITVGAEWRGVQVLWGQCRPAPYAPLVEILTQALTPLRVSQLQRILPDGTFDVLTTLLPGLGNPALNVEETELHQALRACFHALGAIVPHLLILEDLHQMDAATLAVLPKLAKGLAGTPVLIIGTARSGELRDRDDIWESILELDRGGLIDKIALKPLSLENTSALIEQLLGDLAGLDDFPQAVFDRAQGNPLFTIEIIRELLETERLTPVHQGGWTFPRDESWPIPSAIQDVIAARLSRLHPHERNVLEVGAVLGRRFDFELWNSTAGMGEESLLAASNELLHRQFILEDVDTYRFSHDLVHQVVYEHIHEDRAQTLHLRAGESFEKYSPGQKGEIAAHFQRGNDLLKTMRYAQQAGEEAAQVYANQEALKYFGWAIDAAKSTGGEAGDRTLVDVCPQQGWVHELIGQYDAALHEYVTMLAAAERLGDRAAMSVAVRKAGWVTGDRLCDWETGLKESRRALALALGANAEEEAALARVNIGAFHTLRGEHQIALETLTAALQTLQKLEHSPGEACCVHYMAVAYHLLSQHRESLEQYRQASKLYERLGDLRNTAKTQTNIGYVLLGEGRLGEAQDVLESALRLMGKIGAQASIAFVKMGIGALQWYRGRYSESIQTLQPLSGDEREPDTNFYFQALVANHLGQAHWHKGNLGTGLDILRDSLAFGRESDTPTVIVGTLIRLGRFLRLMGAPQEAFSLHEEALTLSAEAAFETGQTMSLTELGLDRVLLGDSETGFENLTTALEKATQQTDWERGQARLNLAEAYLLKGRPAAAFPHLEAGLPSARAMDFRPALLRYYLLLGWGHNLMDAPENGLDMVEKGLALIIKDQNPLIRAGLLAMRAILSAPGGSAPYHWQAELVFDKAAASLGESFPVETLREEWARFLSCINPTAEGQRWAQVRLTSARAASSKSKPITIHWLADAGAADEEIRQKEGKVTLRRARLRRLLREAHDQGGAPTQKDLADALGVSTRTIRGDLRGE